MKKIILIAICAFITTIGNPNFANAAFTDVSTSNKYYKGISYLELQGALDAAENFRPKDKLKKAEFFKILFELFGENGSNLTVSGNFKDVPEGSWFAPYVELGLKYGLVNTKQNKFEPESNLSKIQTLEYLFKMYGVAVAKIDKSSRTDLFKDVTGNHTYYSLIKKAIDLEILEKNTTKLLEPYSPITRGEFSDLLFKFDQWYTNESGSKTGEISGILKSDIFSDVWDRILKNFYLTQNAEIDEDVLFQAAVKGMLESLDDPYTTFITGNASNQFVTNLTGNFQGIGVYLVQDEKTGKVYVTDFVNNSHAYELGMKVGDIIEEVEEVEISQLAYEEIISRIKGPAGTTVKIKIRRGTQTQTFNVERRALSLTLESAEVLDEDIWYLDINLFSSTSFVDVKKLLDELKSEEPYPEGIVIDLRSNSGGYLNSAISIAGHFIPNSKPIVQLDYGYYKEEIINSGVGEYYGIPLFVLIDQYSASASEILAAALQEEGDATLIGKTTFGKGTAQQLVQYWDGSILKLTIAQWLTPSGATIEDVGVTPDITVNGKSKNTDLWLQQVYEELRS